MEQYKWNASRYQWERVDRVQEYKGIKIETVHSHADSYNAPRHRDYRVTWPDGTKTDFPINKRSGGNIKDLKMYIDFKIKYGRI